MAARRGSISCLNTLNKNCAELMMLDNKLETPLHVSIKYGNEDFSLLLITMLKDNKISLKSVDVRNNLKMTPYQLAKVKN